MEGALGPRKRTGKARRAAKCIPCLETTKVNSMASLIKFTGSSGQEPGWKNGQELGKGLVYYSQETVVSQKLG